YTEKQLALVYRKGVYFYDYINSHDRFQETELPPIHEFYSTLKGEYNDLYLKTDVLSLADVWTEFEKCLWNIMNLIPVTMFLPHHYPGMECLRYQ
ncbi:1181_t:CDS:2, partial [Funneliformis geosporum]